MKSLRTRVCLGAVVFGLLVCVLALARIARAQEPAGYAIPEITLPPFDGGGEVIKGDDPTPPPVTTIPRLVTDEPDVDEQRNSGGKISRREPASASGGGSSICGSAAVVLPLAAIGTARAFRRRRAKP
jgi:hypothetical protein